MNKIKKIGSSMLVVKRSYYLILPFIMFLVVLISYGFVFDDFGGCGASDNENSTNSNTENGEDKIVDVPFQNVEIDYILSNIKGSKQSISNSEKTLNKPPKIIIHKKPSGAITGKKFVIKMQNKSFTIVDDIDGNLCLKASSVKVGISCQLTNINNDFLKIIRVEIEYKSKDQCSFSIGLTKEILLDNGINTYLWECKRMKIDINAIDSLGAISTANIKFDLPHNLKELFPKTAKNYYIDGANGSDNNKGTKQKPFKTIQKAIDVTKGESGINVYIKGGNYYLNNNPLNFGKENSGTPELPNLHTSYGTNEVRIIGGQIIPNDSFVKYEGKIYKIDLSILGVNSEINQVFRNSERLTLGRFPNYDAGNYVSGFLFAEAGEDKQKIKYNSEFLNVAIFSEENLKTMKIRLFPNANFSDHHSFINSVDLTSDVISLKTPVTSDYFITDGDRYYLYNFFDALDKDGEWFYDKESSILYLYLDKGPIQSDVFIISTNDSDCIVVEKSKNLIFDKFSFENCGNNGLSVLDSTNITFKNGKIKNTFSNGIFVEYGSSIIIDNNDISHTGEAGIFGTNNSFYLNSMKPTNYIISNNNIHHVGELKITENMGGISLKPVIGANIIGNKIEKTARMGIFFAGINNNVENNETSETNLETKDSAGIYTWESGWLHLGNVIKNNYIHETGGFCKELGKEKNVTPCHTYGVYLDGFSSGVNVVHNTIVGSVGAGIHANYGVYSTIEDNTIIESKKFPWASQISVTGIPKNHKHISEMWKELDSLGKGVPSVTDGISGKALLFDGVDDYVEIGDSPSLDMSDGLTLSFWVKPQSEISYASIFGKFYTEFEIILVTDAKDISYVLTAKYDGDENGQPVQSEKKSYLTDTNGNLKKWKVNEWFNIVWTLNGTIEKVYVNGEELGKNNYAAKHNPQYSGIKAANNNINIGRRFKESVGTYFNGTIDELMLFNRELGSNEVKVIFDSKGSDLVNIFKDSSLVGYWTFNEGTAIDSSGYENDGILGGYNGEKFFDKFPELKNITQSFPEEDMLIKGYTITGNTIIYPSSDTYLYKLGNLDISSIIGKNIIYSGTKPIEVFIKETQVCSGNCFSKSWEDWNAAYDKNSMNVENNYSTNEFLIESIGKNLIENGTFDTGTAPWSSWYTKSFKEDCGYDGGCIKLENSNGQLGSAISNKFNLSKDKIYNLKFSVKTDKGNTIEIFDDKLMIHEYVYMDDNWRDYSFIIMPDSDIENVSLNFRSLPAENPIFYLDNISMEEVTGILNDPKDDYLYFINNEKNEKTYSLDGDYCDLFGNTVSGLFTLQQNESAVFLNCFCNNDFVCNNKENNSTCPNDCI